MDVSITDAFVKSISQIFYPENAIISIQYAYQNGLWSIAFFSQVKGLLILTFWLIELAIPFIIAFKFVSEIIIAPFDKEQEKWFEKHTLFDDYQSIANETAFLELEGNTIHDKIGKLKKGGISLIGKISIFYLPNASSAYLLYENKMQDMSGKGVFNQRNVKILFAQINSLEGKKIIDTYHGKKQFYLDY